MSIFLKNNFLIFLFYALKFINSYSASLYLYHSPNCNEPEISLDCIDMANKPCRSLKINSTTSIGFRISLNENHTHKLSTSESLNFFDITYFRTKEDCEFGDENLIIAERKNFVETVCNDLRPFDIVINEKTPFTTESIYHGRVYEHCFRGYFDSLLNGSLFNVLALNTVTITVVFIIGLICVLIIFVFYFSRYYVVHNKLKKIDKKETKKEDKHVQQLNMFDYLSRLDTSWSNWKMFWGTVQCSIALIIFELQNMYALFFSILAIATIEEQVYDPSRTLNQENNVFIYLILLFSMFLYVLFDMFLIGIWCFKYMFDPFQFCMYYFAYKEWIVFRMFSFTFHCYFIVVTFGTYFGMKFFWFPSSIFAMFNPGSVFSSFMNFSTWIFKFIIPELFLIIKTMSFLTFDGIGSIMIVRKLHKMSINQLRKFPSISVSFYKILTGGFENVFSDILFTLALVESNFDVEEKEKSINYTHLNWKYINKKSDNEIMFLKKFFFDSAKLEKFESNKRILLRNRVLHSPMFTSLWLKELFGSVKCKKRKVVPVQNEKVNEEKEIMVNEEKEIIVNED